MATITRDLGDIDNTLILGDDNYVITGQDGDNTLTLGNGSNQLTLGDGNNTLTLGDGVDQISAGVGNNTITTTGSGTDTITLTDGNNTISAGSGPDVIVAGNGLNTVTAGDGNDAVTLGNGFDQVTTGNGNSEISVGNGAGDTVFVGTGSNVIELGSGSTDIVHTGSGHNTVAVSAAAAGTAAILGGLTSNDGSRNTLMLTSAGVIDAGGVSGFEIYQLANGGANGLTLTDANFARLPGGSITVLGGDGGNTVDAAALSAAHAVIIHAGPGTNTLSGGAGNDTFYGSSGTTTVDGGSGINTMIYAGPQSSYHVTVSGLDTHVVGADNTDTLRNVQQIRFTEPPPTALVLTSASDSGVSSNDNITNVTMPTFTGRGEAGDVVTLLDGGASIGSSTVDVQGAWSVTATRPLAGGANPITATQTNTVGDISAASRPVTVILNTTAPLVTAQFGAEAGASSVDKITPTLSLSGSAAPNSAVILAAGATSFGAATTDPSGTWRIDLPQLPNGRYTAVASQTDSAGNIGTASLSFNVIAPPPPVAGVSEIGVSSTELSQQLAGNSSLQFSDGTETIVLADGKLSVGPDTSEAFLARLYHGVLNRAPDGPGLSFWDTMLNGSSPATVAQRFLGSDEYQAAHAVQTDNQFVQSLYSSMLGRPADDSGAALWIQTLAGGASRGQVLAGFANSPEAKLHWVGATSGGVFARDPDAAIVREDYQTAFGRDSETTGLAFWTNLLKSGGTPAQLAQDLTMTSEFQSAHSPQTNLQYVASLYQNGLGREVDPGAALWTNALQGGAMSRGDVLASIAQSPEGAQHLNWALA